ncbi:MAG: HAMP domain-containing sensor histidine kinase [Ktedonobacteraceae bacterium]
MSIQEHTTNKKGSRKPPFPLFLKFGPLRRRIVFWNIMVLLLVLIFLGSMVYLLVNFSLLQNLDQQLQTEGERLQRLTQAQSAAGHPFNTAFFDLLVREEKGDEFAPDTPYIKLLDTNQGRILRRSPNLLRERIPFSNTNYTHALHGQQAFRTYQESGGRSARLLTLPLRDAHQHIVLIAQVSLPQGDVDQVRNLLALFLSVGSVLAVLITYVADYLLVVHELRPLRTLSTTMSRLSTGDLGQRITQQSAVAEIRMLTDAFNQMSERLEASFVLQRDFVADVSHELRTPLTSLRGQADVLLLNPALNEDMRQDVQQLRTELERLSRLVNNLLTNARAEVGMLPHVAKGHTQVVELDSLVLEVARQSRFLNRMVTLELGQFQQVSVSGDTDLLKQLLFNFVDNALTYTRPGDVVYLDLTCTQDVPDAVKEKRHDRQDKWAMICVRDTGPGIDEADLPHIFERHYRSHHTDTRTPVGSGLGLSIASLIAEAHGGVLTVESKLGKGSSFCIWLPTRKEL